MTNVVYIVIFITFLMSLNVIFSEKKVFVQGDISNFPVAYVGCFNIKYYIKFVNLFDVICINYSYYYFLNTNVLNGL